MLLIILSSVFAGANSTFALYHALITDNAAWLWLLAVNIPLFALCFWGICIDKEGDIQK